MKTLNTILLPLLLVSLFSLHQQVYGQFRIDRTALSNGGTRTGNANFRLMGTVGQSAAGVTNNNAFQMSSGFWFGIDLITGVSEKSPITPLKYKLFSNYPNPFNPTTTIRYEIPKSTFVTLKIYNIAGQLIAMLVNEQKSAGRYSITWNAENVSSGVYIYRIRAGNFCGVKKGLVIK